MIGTLETRPNPEMHPLQELLSAANHMPARCRSIAQYIVDNPHLVASMSIAELAAATRSNKTTVVRLCKFSGYNGYRDLRIALLENRGLVRGAELLGFDVPAGGDADDDVLHVAREVIKINLEVLQETLTLLDEGTLRRAVERILLAKHVFFVGFGSSAPIAQDAYQRFIRLQVPSSACSDPHVLASIVANLGRRELLFCISYTGATRDVVEALETATRRKTPTITLTSVPGSPAADLSDIVLVSAVRRKPRAAETVASRVAQLAVIDIICAIIALRRKSRLAEPTERIKEELGKKRSDNRKYGRRKRDQTRQSNPKNATSVDS
jgi:DNA-binding MurR/RpiR family transcriptional regulator